MIVRNLLLTMWMAGTLAAQTFIQMSDPQFGMYTMYPKPSASDYYTHILTTIQWSERRASLRAATRC